MADTKIVVVCSHCFEHNSENASLEINFRDQCIYYVCSKCNKRNQMTLKPLTAQPYPKARLQR